MIIGLHHHGPSLSVINKKDGSLSKSIEQTLERWCEHYKDILNHPPADVCPALDEAATSAVPDAEISSDASTLQEVTKAIRLRNGKAAELLKFAEQSAQTSRSVSESVVHGQSFSRLEGGPHHLHIKASQKANCSSYRLISLLSVPSKVSAHVLLGRLHALLIR